MNRKEITEAIEARRRELGITKQELSLRCDMDVSNLTNITNGHGCRIDTLVRILEELGLSLTSMPRKRAHAPLCG